MTLVKSRKIIKSGFLKRFKKYFGSILLRDKEAIFTNFLVKLKPVNSTYKPLFYKYSKFINKNLTLKKFQRSCFSELYASFLMFFYGTVSYSNFFFGLDYLTKFFINGFSAFSFKFGDYLLDLVSGSKLDFPSRRTLVHFDSNFKLAQVFSSRKQFSLSTFNEYDEFSTYLKKQVFSYKL